MGASYIALEGSGDRTAPARAKKASVNFALTKIQPPRPRADCIARQRLDAQLAAALTTHRLVLVCAPAGFGKTALLSGLGGWLDPSTARAWISADEDDDLGRFAACLVAALEPYDLPWRASPDALLAALGGGRVARAAFTAGLVNALLAAQAQRGVIVVEDAHRIEDPQVFEFLDGLIEKMPAGWVLVVSSRVDPPLSLARLRARGEMAELRQDVLRFTEAEVRVLLAAAAAPRAHADRTAETAAAAPSAAPTSAADLIARTDGWAAGLTLAIGSTQGAHAVGAGAPRRRLFEYLAAEVLQTMPRELREFLLRCSVLAELSPQRCTAVTGSAQAARLLGQVERSAPFVSVLDDREPVLRLHDLFRDCLDELLRHELPDEVPVLLHRAADGEPDLVRRVGYLLQAGAWTDAEVTLTELGTALLTSGNVAPVLRLIDQFPPALRDASPRLAHLRGLCAWAHWDLLTACASLERAAAGYQALGHDDAAQRARVLWVIGLTASGQVKRAVELLAELRRRPMDTHTETTAWQAASWHMLAGCRLGDVAPALARMVDLLERTDNTTLWLQSVPPTEMLGLPGARPHLQRYIDGALARSPAEPPTPLRVLANLLQAALHLWAGRPDAAAEGLRAADSDSAWLNRPPQLVSALGRFAALCHAVRGDREAALAAADALLHGLTADPRTSGRVDVWLNHMHYFKLRMAATLGDVATQREMARRIEANFDPAENPMFLRERACLPGRLAELDARWADAAQHYADLLAGDGVLDLHGQHAELRVRLAHAWVRLQRPADAAATLAPLFDRVAASGEPGGVLLAGREVLAMLARARWGTHLGAAQVRQLQTWAALAGAGEADAARVASPPTPTAAGAPAAVPLSAREHEVLRCIAAGDSNKLIARAFDLSPNTVKRHVSNILDKLGLNSRGQAAAWYRQQH